MLEAAAIAATDGQIIAGKYKVLGLLGRGGMGEVVAAEHLHLHHTVAIKLMSPRTVLSPEIVARFLQEARAAVRLSSEHVTRVLDMGTLDSGLPYIVMERLEGQDLEQIIEAGGPLSIEQAVTSVLQACEALAEAHSIGIVHRDLKPSNLFLTRRPDDRWFVKVLDFGISKFAEEHGGEGITTTADVLGTPAYMAPEQIRSAKLVDARTDIWALGLILAECLSGKPVYEGGSKLGILAAITADPVPSLELQRGGTPPGLEKVVLRCLQKNPADRYQNVADLADALVPFAGAEPDSAATRIGRLVQGKVVRPSRSHRSLKIAASAGAAALVAGIAITLQVRRRPTVDSNAEAPTKSSAQPSHEGPPTLPGNDSRATDTAERRAAAPFPKVETDSPAESPLPSSSAKAGSRNGSKSTPKLAPSGAKATRGPDGRAVRAPSSGALPDGLEDRK